MLAPPVCPKCEGSELYPCGDCIEKRRSAPPPLSEEERDRLARRRGWIRSLDPLKVAEIVAEEWTGLGDPPKGCTHRETSVPGVYQMQDGFDLFTCSACYALVEDALRRHEMKGAGLMGFPLSGGEPMFSTTKIKRVGPGQGMLAEVPEKQLIKEAREREEGLRYLKWFKKFGVRWPSSPQ